MVINDKEHYNKVRSSISMNNMRKLLDNKDYSVIKLATETGVSGSTINSYLNGQKLPSVTNLVSIANYLNCNIDFLLDRTNNPMKINEFDTWSDDFNILIHNLKELPQDKLELAKAYIKALRDTK